MTSAPLACLTGGALAGHFHAWRGVSGKRYVFSVFAASSGVSPDYQDAILVAAAVDAGGARRIVGIADTGRLPDVALNGAFAVRALGRGATEWHVHLLAGTAEARRAVMLDLQPAHSRSAEMAGDPGERPVLEPKLDEVLVRGADVVWIGS